MSKYPFDKDDYNDQTRKEIVEAFKFFGAVAVIVLTVLLAVSAAFCSNEEISALLKI